jgi:3-hydroxyisobutyrate dehydrogenase-like beta-hydroxyacid dehydrogenase
MDVAVAGLGLMGTAIAERLLDAGHQVTVFNRSAAKTAPLVERGATAATSLTDIWARASVCITMLADSAALEAVAAELLDGDGAKGGTLIDMSTVSAATSAEVARLAADAGVAYLRAPVTGNPVAVRAGNLGMIVSGDEALLESMRPLLLDIGPTVFYLGGGEKARVMKLALNLMIAGTAELLAEAVALGEAHGLDRGTLVDVIAGSAIGSPFIGYKKGPLVADDYTSTFSARLMRKDLGMAMESAAEGGLPLPVTELVDELLESCVEAGLGDLDFSALLPRLKREADHIRMAASQAHASNSAVSPESSAPNLLPK